MSVKCRSASSITKSYRISPIFQWERWGAAPYLGDMTIELLVLGAVAGALTTVAGLGGGMLLVAVLSALHGGHDALALTAPALLASNLHRAYLFRKDVDVRTVRAFAIGAVPAAAVAGFFVPDIPEAALAVILA